MAILSHTDNLKANASVRMSASEKGLLKKQIRQLEAEAATLKGKKIDAVAETAAAKGAPKSAADRLDLDVQKKALARRFDEPLADLQARLDELNAKLSRANNVGKAKEELKRFSSLSREDQIKELGLDAPMRKVEMTRAVRDAVAAIRAERKKTPTEIHAEQVAEEAIKQRQMTLLVLNVLKVQRLQASSLTYLKHGRAYGRLGTRSISVRCAAY